MKMFAVIICGLATALIVYWLLDVFVFAVVD